MSENFVIVSTVDQAKSRYNLKSSSLCLPIPAPSVISAGDKAWVITSQEPNSLQSMTFGYNSSFSQKRMDLLNLKTAITDREEDEQEYDRLMNIFIRPQFAASIHSCRCAVMVDAFLVSAPDNTIYLIHLQDHERPFALAGIYSQWLDVTTNQTSTGFTIITTAANPMLKRVGVEHMPMILTQRKVFEWLDLTQDRRKLYALIHTFPDETMNGYPVSSKIFSGQLSNIILQPIGRKLKPDQKDSRNLKNK